jgi:tape measure domain-containing protein
VAISLGDAVLTVGADTSRLKRDVQGGVKAATGSAARTAEGGGRTIGGKIGGGILAAARTFAAPLAGVFVAAGGIAAVKYGVQIASQNEQAKISFTTMLGSAQKAGSFIKQLQAFAAKTPFDFPGLQKSASSLISVGINAKDVIPIMTNLGNVTSGMGTGAEGIQRATTAIQQMTAAQRISGEDLNQLRDAGIPVYDLLAKALDKPKAQVAKLVQGGKLGKDALDKMMGALKSGAGLERFSGLMDKQSASLQGLWSTLQDTFGQGMAKAVQPALPLMKSALQGMTNLVGPWTKHLGNEIQTGLDFGNRVATALRPTVDAVRTILTGGEIHGGGLASQLGIVMKAVSPLSGVISGALPALKEMGGAWKMIGRDLGGLVVQIIPMLLPILIQLIKIISQAAETILPVFSQVLAKVVGAIFPVLVKILRAILPLFMTLVSAILPIVVQLFTALAPVLVPVAQLLGQLASAILPLVVLALKLVLPILTFLIKIIAGIIGVAAKLVAAFVHVITHSQSLGVAIGQLKTIAHAIWRWFTDSFVPFFSHTLPHAFHSVIAYIVANWHKLVGYIVDPFKAAWHGITIAWGWIRDSFRSAWNWVKRVFSALWYGVKQVFTHPISSTVTAFHTLLGATGLRAPLVHVVNWITGWFAGRWAAIQGLFTHPVQTAKNILSKILGYGGPIRTAFSNAVAAISRIWGRVKSVMAAPVRWVIDNVINKGILKGINTVLRFVGLGKQQIKWIPTAFASGGVFMPNQYTPGRDIGLAALSGSEAIMRPEFTRAVGGAWVEGANKAARTGGASAVRSFLGGFAQGGVVWPTNTRRLSPSYPGHSGVDIAAGMGAPIWAAQSGRISYTGWNRGFGDAIFERLASGLEVVYGHSSKVLARMGQLVQAGDLLGRVGQTGHASGPHLHLELGQSAFGTASNRNATLAWLRGAKISGGGGGGSIFDMLNPANLIGSTVGKLLSGMPGADSPLKRMIAGVPRHLVGSVVNWAKDKLSLFGSASPTGSGVNRWAPVVRQALAMNHLPTSGAYISAWLRQIQSESGGNPRAIQGNIGDINNVTGDLAKGLVQVIGATFRAYSFPGHKNVFNGLDNLLAGINYAKHTYPNMLAVIGHGHGYDAGGWLPPGFSVNYNGTGRREPKAVFTQEQWTVLSKLASGRGRGGPSEGDTLILVVEGTPLTATVKKVMRDETGKALLKA